MAFFTKDALDITGFVDMMEPFYINKGNPPSGEGASVCGNTPQGVPAEARGAPTTAWVTPYIVVGASARAAAAAAEEALLQPTSLEEASGIHDTTFDMDGDVDIREDL